MRLERGQGAESHRIMKRRVTEWKVLGMGRQEDVGVDPSSTTSWLGELGNLGVAPASSIKQGKY